jgi:hypothetical protein
MHAYLEKFKEVIAKMEAILEQT